MFKARLFSGIVLVLLAIILVSSGGKLLYCVTALLSLIGMYELYRVMKFENKALGAAGYLACISYYGLIWFEGPQHVTLMAVAALMLILTIYVFTFPSYGTEQVTVAFFGIFYVGIMLSYLYQVRAMADGRYLVWLIFLSSWGCDTCAYCTGMLFGKHKLAPILSPKKSIEGAVGGVIGAGILGILYGYVFGGRMIEIGNPQLACGAACAIAAVISQVGDLAASAIKRNHDVKDYGHLIPGHGGVLDRFDSVIFTAPAIFFAVTFLR